MKLLDRQSAFYKKTRVDNRVSPTHISLYFALLHELANKRKKGVLILRRDLIMRKAKISSRVTYNKCMRELNDYGYIEYLPSYNIGASRVIIKEPEAQVCDTR